MNTEEAFFAHFDLPFIPPTVRENGKELERLDELAGLVQLDDIVSDLHMHTTWSDGAHSGTEMGEALIARGYTHGCYYRPFTIFKSGEWFNTRAFRQAKT